MAYQYRKLRGRITEICGSQRALAEKVGLSETAVTMKMTGKIGFSQDDILKWAEVLQIEPEEYGSYFFT